MTARKGFVRIPGTPAAFRAAGIWLRWFERKLPKDGTLLTPKDDPDMKAFREQRMRTARHLWTAARDPRRRWVELPRDAARDLGEVCWIAWMRGVVAPRQVQELSEACRHVLSRRPGPQRLRGRRIDIALGSLDVDPAQKSRLRRRKAVDEWLDFIKITGQTLLTGPSFEEWQASRRHRQ
jgi:hypothetical protein